MSFEILAFLSKQVSKTSLFFTSPRYSEVLPKRLGRAFMLLVFLGWLAFLFLVIAMFLGGDSDAEEFFAGISSGLSTEIAGAFLAVLLLDTLGRSWEEWDDESIRILEEAKTTDKQLPKLIQQLKEHKDNYILAAQESRRLSKSWWARWRSENYIPPSYYEGAIAAIDSVLSALPAEENAS